MHIILSIYSLFYRREKDTFPCFQSSEILELVELAVGGEVVDQIFLNTRRFGIHVRYQEPFRNDPEGARRFNELFSIKSSELMRVVRSRRNTVKVDRGKAVLKELSVKRISS